MRKIIGIALALSLATALIAAGSAGAAETKKRTRKQTKEYDAPGNVLGLGGRITLVGQDIGGPFFIPRRGENFVAVRVVDDLGQPVAGSISQDYDGDTFADRSVDFCGATKRPVRIEWRYEVIVFIGQGPCYNGEPAAASQGKVIATFSNIR